MPLGLCSLQRIALLSHTKFLARMAYFCCALTGRYGQCTISAWRQPPTSGQFDTTSPTRHSDELSSSSLPETCLIVHHRVLRRECMLIDSSSGRLLGPSKFVTRYQCLSQRRTYRSNLCLGTTLCRKLKLAHTDSHNGPSMKLILQSIESRTLFMQHSIAVTNSESSYI